MPSVLPPTRCALTAPFHPYQRRCRRFGGLLSVALSVGSRPPGVTWHPARRARTFLHASPKRSAATARPALRAGTILASAALPQLRPLAPPRPAAAAPARRPRCARTPAICAAIAAARAGGSSASNSFSARASNARSAPAPAAAGAPPTSSVISPRAKLASSARDGGELRERAAVHRLVQFGQLARHHGADAPPRTNARARPASRRSGAAPRTDISVRGSAASRASSLAALAGARRQKALEHEAVRRQAGDAECRRHGGGAGQRANLDAGRCGRAYQRDTRDRTAAACPRR